MEEGRELKIFLVKHFLMLMAVIALCEMGINMIYTYLVFPYLRDRVGGPFFSDFGMRGYGASAILMSILGMMAGWVLSLLPARISVQIYQLMEAPFGNTFFIEAGKAFGDHRDTRGMYYLGCLLLLLLLLIIALLPYIGGALIFSNFIRREVQELIERKKDERRHYDRRRSLMLSDIAHDLKTPITTVAGYAQALRDGMVTDEEKQKQYLEAICNKSQRMDGLISLLFEYVKIDSEGFVLHKQKADIIEVVRESVAMVYADFERKGIELYLDIPEECVWWEIDKLQFSRAMENLLNNDLRHVEAGQKVMIRVVWEEDLERLRIILADTGEQISNEVARHIFEPFVMGDASRSSKGGSGLGLSISSKIVRMHGGRLVLDRNSRGEYTKAFIVILLK